MTDAGRAQIAQPGFSAAGNGLLNALIAYWPGNEASGDALDLHTNGLTLTDTNTVTSNPGKVYALARQYTRINSEYHARLGDDAQLSAGDTELTIACWVQLDYIPVGAVEYTAVSKYNTALGQREYFIGYIAGSTNRFQAWYGNSTGGSSTQLIASSFGVPIAGIWYFCVTWHDPTADKIYIQINNGVVDSKSWSGGIVDGTYPFKLGARGAGINNFNGRIGPVMFWKSAAGGGGVLTAAQRTALYNAGAGLPYASFTL